MSKRTHPSAPVIRLQRAYDEPGERDGYRVLVDRFWPAAKQGIPQLDEWARDPRLPARADPLFGHKPEERWLEFRRRYRAQLAAPEQVARLSALCKAAGKGVISLVYGARDEEQNQAVVIGEVLAEMMRAGK